MRRVTPILLALGLVLAAVPTVAEPGPGMVGAEAAPFNLQDLDGDWHSLGDYENKVVFFFVVGWG